MTRPAPNPNRSRAGTPHQRGAHRRTAPRPVYPLPPLAVRAEPAQQDGALTTDGKDPFEYIGNLALERAQIREQLANISVRRSEVEAKIHELAKKIVDENRSTYRRRTVVKSLSSESAQCEGATEPVPIVTHDGPLLKVVDGLRGIVTRWTRRGLGTVALASYTRLDGVAVAQHPRTVERHREAVGVWLRSATARRAGP